MTDKKIGIGVVVDASEAQDGLKKVSDASRDMARVVKQSGAEAGKGIDSVGAGGGEAAAKVDRATKSIINSIQRTTTQLEAGGKAGSKYYELLASQRNINADALRPYIDQLKQVEGAQTKVGVSAAQTAAAMRGVPAQFTDIVTSLQGGQAPLTVFLQQGGQLKDMFGGMGNAAKALGGYMIGLVNPFTIAAAAATALGAAYYYGSEQSSALNKALVLTGNYAGTTSVKLNEVAEKAGQLTGKYSEAREAVTLLAESGKFSFNAIQNLSTTIVAASSVTGKSIQETVDQFEKLKKEPTKAIVELNEKYNFLTVDIYKQVKALEDRGEKEKAAALASNAYADSVTTKNAKVLENLGYIERAWKGIKTETQGALDTFLSIGRASDDAQKLAVAKNQLQSMKQTAGNVLPSSGAAKEIAEQERLIKILEDRIAVSAKVAKAEGEVASQQKRSVDQRKEFDEYVKKNTESLKTAALDSAKNAFSSATKGFASESAEYKKASEIYLSAQKKIEEQFKVKTTKEETAYASLSKTIREKVALSELELSTEKPLTESQKMRVKIAEAYEQAHSKAAKAKILELNKSVDLIKSNELIRASYERAAEAVGNFKAAFTAKDITDLIQKQDKAYFDLIKSQDAYRQSLEENADLIALEASLRGQSYADRNTAIDQFKIEIGLQKELLKIKQDILLTDAQKTERSQAARENADFAKSQAALKAQQGEWTKFYDDIYNGLSDSLYRGFEAGKGFFQNFWDGIKNLFKTTVLKLAVQGVMTGVIGAGTSGMANAQGLSSTGMSMMQSVSAGKSLWDSFSTAAGAAGMAGSMGAGIAGFGNLIGSTSISAFGTGMGLSTAAAGQAAGAYGAAGMAGTGTALSAGSSVAAAMPYVAAAIAAFQASKAVNGEYRLGGLSADMGALLGFAPRLFGMADKKFTGQTVSGNLGTSNLSRDASWTQSGGLFRSDRSGTWSYSLADSTATQDGKRYQDSASLASDQAMLKGLNTGYDAMKKASVDFAKTLGINADLINARTDAMSFKIGATQEETDKAIAEMFANVANSIAETVIPGIKQFAKQGESSSATLSRLALNLRGVNDVFTLINHRLFETSALGGKFASELVEVFGGLDKLQALSQSYFDLYFTDAEKAALRANEMSKMFSALNISMPQTKDQLRNMIEALDLNTESGRKTYASLMQIAPLFGEVADANAAAAKITAESLLSTSRNVAALVPALDLTNRGFGQVTSSLQTQSVGLISVASLYEQASGKTVAYSEVLASSNATLTGAQLAAMQLQDQIAQLSNASTQTSFDFSKLAMRLKDVDTMTFVETVKGVFAALATNVKETLGAIATERVAIRNNAMQIISPSVMSRASIEQGVSSVNVNLPANAAVVNSQERVAQLTRLQASFAAREDMLRGMAIDIAQLDANFMPTVGGFSGVTGSNYPAQIRQAKADLLARQNLLASDKVKVATELPDATKDARKAQLDYAAAMQTFALEASKSVGKLSRLREETMRYFDAQKQLAGLMSASASGLRETIAGYRFAALDPQSQFDQLQSKYASTYAMALSTDGEALADYGGKLNSMLNPLLEKAKEMLSGADYSAFASTALARAELIAGRLETLTPKNYDVESLGLLGQIDASLEALDNAARSADKLIIDAINAGAASTVNAINAKPVTQVDYTPVVAAIQNSSVDNTNQKLLEEIKGLRQSMEQLRYEAQATAIATKRAADIAERKQFDTPGVYEP